MSDFQVVDSEVWQLMLKDSAELGRLKKENLGLHNQLDAKNVEIGRLQDNVMRLTKAAARE